MAAITSFKQDSWFAPEPILSLLYAKRNWSDIGENDEEVTQVRRDLADTAVAIGSYIAATYVYPVSLPIAGCLVSTISPNAARWGTGTYLLLTGLKGVWAAWGSGKAAVAISHVGMAVLGYLATTPVPTMLMNRMSSLFNDDSKKI